MNTVCISDIYFEVTIVRRVAAIPNDTGVHHIHCEDVIS